MTHELSPITHDPSPMTPINIRLSTDNDQLGWDNYVLSNPDAGPYHLYAWKTAVEQAYGHKGYYLMAEDATNGSCVGILPLICFFKMPWGKKSSFPCHTVIMPALWDALQSRKLF